MALNANPFVPEGNPPYMPPRSPTRSSPSNRKKVLDEEGVDIEVEVVKGDAVFHPQFISPRRPETYPFVFPPLPDSLQLRVDRLEEKIADLKKLKKDIARLEGLTDGFSSEQLQEMIHTMKEELLNDLRNSQRRTMEVHRDQEARLDWSLQEALKQLKKDNVGLREHLGILDNRMLQLEYQE